MCTPSRVDNFLSQHEIENALQFLCTRSIPKSWCWEKCIPPPPFVRGSRCLRSLPGGSFIKYVFTVAVVNCQIPVEPFAFRATLPPLLGTWMYYVDKIFNIKAPLIAPWNCNVCLALVLFCHLRIVHQAGKRQEWNYPPRSGCIQTEI